MTLSPLEQFANAVNADMTAAITAASGTVPVFKFGPEHLAKENKPPRIIWVPTEDVMRETIGPGGRTNSVTGVPSRSVATTFDGVEVHVWGRDYGEADALKRQLILSVHMQGVGTRELVGTSGKWNNETLDVRYGREWIWTFALWVPVADEPYQYAPSDVAPLTDDMLGNTAGGCN